MASVSCPMAGFGISGVESSGSVTRESVVYVLETFRIVKCL